MLVSIQLNSNRPIAIAELISNIEETSSNPSDIEVLINTDAGDDECKKTIELLQSKTAIQLRFIQTNIIKSYKDLWKPLNELLKHTDPSSHFVANFSDEFRFKTKGWDDVIRKYINYYEDGVFRVRLSRYRYYSYSDFWECVFAPDSLAFYSKKWLDIVGMWCPCLGPDSWQQLVSYYLITARKFSHIQYNRDIVEPFIEFKGEGVSVGLDKAAIKERVKNNVELWFETVSHEMQEKAKYAAANLQAHIMTSDTSSRSLITTNKPNIFQNKKIGEILFHNDSNKKKIRFFYHGHQIYTLSYKLNKWKFFIINNLRKINFSYYVGDLEKYFDRDVISNLNVYLRIKTHGSNFNIQKPEFLKRKKIGFLWPVIKLPLLTYQIIKNIINNDRK